MAARPQFHEGFARLQHQLDTARGSVPKDSMVPVRPGSEAL